MFTTSIPDIVTSLNCARLRHNWEEPTDDRCGATWAGAGLETADRPG
jgi:hypothetical protein